LVNATLKWVLVVAALAFAGTIVVPFFIGSPTKAVGPAGLVGQNAPVFDLLDDNGTSVSLARYRGRVVLMNLWASWCPPCRAEMPDLQRLAADYRDTNLTIVGVNEGESADRARDFAASLRIAFPIWLDDQQRYGRVYAALGLPTTVIVGPDGVVVRGFDGALTYGEMRAAVKGLVRKR
jgi:peroxiredoxin